MERNVSAERNGGLFQLGRFRIFRLKAIMIASGESLRIIEFNNLIDKIHSEEIQDACR